MLFFVVDIMFHQKIAEPKTVPVPKIDGVCNAPIAISSGWATALLSKS